jgi:hypothetical protein
MHPLIVILFVLCFLGGLYFITYKTLRQYKNVNTNTIKTPNSTNIDSSCPNLLIQKGSKIYLYNNKKKIEPGINPIVFDNLEQYIELITNEKSKGRRCPVLYLQQTIAAQGQEVYKMRPSITEPQGGLPPITTTNVSSTTCIPSKTAIPYYDPGAIAALQEDKVLDGNSLKKNSIYPNPTLLVDATRNDFPYNVNSYPGFDQTSYYVGTTTPLDAMNIAEQEKKVSANPMDPNWGGADYTYNLVKSGFYKDSNVKIWVGNN